MLKLNNIQKSFGDTQVINGVNLYLECNLTGRIETLFTYWVGKKIIQKILRYPYLNNHLKLNIN